MSITLVTYAYVQPGGAVPTCARESVSTDVESYLEAHVASLLKGATANGSSPPARFQSGDGEGRFQALLEGSDAEFLDAATQLAERLHKEMDNRAKRGFFVAMRSSDGQRARVAVLKLDVHGKSAATMARTRGRLTLEAVKDLLDIPGQLQKGAVFHDDRADSDIVVGDKLTETAFYFLRAIDVVQMSSAKQATAAIVSAVNQVAGRDRTVSVIRALESEQETTTEDFLARHPNLLEAPEQAQVAEALRVRKRPVARFDARNHLIEEVVSADGITIRGRATTLASKLQVSPNPQRGGWLILIEVDEEPRRKFR
jgi:hypothetical protein